MLHSLFLAFVTVQQFVFAPMTPLVTAVAPQPPPAAQFITSYGSTGAHGALVVGANQTRVINLATEGTYDPVNWVVRFDYTSVDIGNNATVRFLNHPSRAPVAWIVQGGVLVQSGADVQLTGASGSYGGPTTNYFAEPGPGGFRGGRPANTYNTLWSAGFGPGGAKGDSADTVFGGAGASHALAGAAGGNSTAVPHLAGTYGGSAIFQLIGGSGGGSGRFSSLTGSYNNGGGGAGGGAILIAADGSVDVYGYIQCNGGVGYSMFSPDATAGGGGSGGAVRLASLTQVYLRTGSYISATGGSGGSNGYGFNGGSGGPGRIRIEAPRAQPLIAGSISHEPSTGEPQPAFRPSSPQVRIASIGGVPVPSEPLAHLGPQQGGGESDTTLVEPGLIDIVVESENLPLDSLIYLRITRATGHADVLGPLTLSVGTSVTFTNVDVSRGYSALQARAVLP